METIKAFSQISKFEDKPVEFKFTPNGDLIDPWFNVIMLESNKYVFEFKMQKSIPSTINETDVKTSDSSNKFNFEIINYSNVPENKKEALNRLKWILSNYISTHYKFLRLINDAQNENEIGFDIGFKELILSKPDINLRELIEVFGILIPYNYWLKNHTIVNPKVLAYLLFIDEKKELAENILNNNIRISYINKPLISQINNAKLTIFKEESFTEWLYLTSFAEKFEKYIDDLINEEWHNWYDDEQETYNKRISNNPFKNDNLDMDQQNQEFWDW